MPSYAAVDLGATSGRVILGRLDGGRFSLTETARFTHEALPEHGTLRWDTQRLWRETLRGLVEADRRAAASGDPLAGIGVDTWAVDHGFVRPDGSLVAEPFHYRDARTQGVPDEVFATIPADELYRRCGLQVQPFNTIFQWVAGASTTPWDEVDAALLMPDLCSLRLTGRRVAEVTNASTTGLLDVRSRTWSDATVGALHQRWGIPAARILPSLVEPGTILGPVATDDLATPAQVVAVASHDTASSIAALPATRTDVAYISSGTWSLVGLELDEPVLSEASRRANFTNELGVDASVCFLKNVTGLWVLSESIAAWRRRGRDVDLAALLAAAAHAPGLTTVVDINHPSLLPPGDMPARLARLAGDTGQTLADDPARVTRCILDSLALAYRRAIRDACALAGRDVGVVHVVGGGAQNQLLCQLTAEATGLEVVAGPAEGAALGNLLVQARALGAITGGVDALREVASASCTTTTHRPGVLPGLDEAAWARAEALVLP